jgi:outer membrane lipoprotein SlyB
MNKYFITLCFLGVTTLLGGCTSTQVGTVAGAGAGAGIGYAVGGGWGSAIGAGAGALIGNQIGQDQDRRNYYYRRGY